MPKLHTSHMFRADIRERERESVREHIRGLLSLSPVSLRLPWQHSPGKQKALCRLKTCIQENEDDVITPHHVDATPLLYPTHGLWIAWHQWLQARGWMLPNKSAAFLLWYISTTHHNKRFTCGWLLHNKSAALLCTKIPSEKIIIYLQ
jgi:hypothetical protein